MNYKALYQTWLSDDYYDEGTKEELRGIAGQEAEIEDRFFRTLHFGTAGLRGIMGAGSNRINVYTIRRATQGLADYIIQQKKQSMGVVIAYDSRHRSSEFALEAALCLAGNGIKAYLFEELRPTPELSFAIRHLRCVAGINITASHNPPEYNGYKVYWEDGAQITPPHDGGIMEMAEAIADHNHIHTLSEKDAVQQQLLQYIGKETDDAYAEEIKRLILDPEETKQLAANIKIVYTPLHGAGGRPVERLLREIGFKQVWVVKEQQKPDGDFPTVTQPNPESKDAFNLALQLAEEKHADVILATDPDADRLGVYVYNKKTKGFEALTGNVSGVLLAYYELSRKKELQQLPENGVLLKSIVTTGLLNEIGAHFGLETREVLTGFKWIGKSMLELEQSGQHAFLFGMEESYGCLAGTYCRDKDAVAATVLFCEAAAYYSKQGKSLWEVLQFLYETYGYFYEGTISLTLTGIEGMKKIQCVMEILREDPAVVSELFSVEKIIDYQRGIQYDRRTGETTETGLPRAEVLFYRLLGADWFCVRPSGTEPKLKFYYGIKGDNEAEKADKIQKTENKLHKLIKMLTEQQ